MCPGIVGIRRQTPTAGSVNELQSRLQPMPEAAEFPLPNTIGYSQQWTRSDDTNSSLPQPPNVCVRARDGEFAEYDYLDTGPGERQRQLRHVSLHPPRGGEPPDH